MTTVIVPGSPELQLLAERVIDDHNKGRPNRHVKPEDRGRRGAWTLMPKTPNACLVFRSYDAALVWIEECLGQISDGKYGGRSGMEFFQLGVRVEPALRRSGVDGNWQPRGRVSFTDLAFLFDAARPEPETEVREIYSRLPANDLLELLRDIARAANGGVPEYTFRLRHPDGRVCALANTQRDVQIDLTLTDGETISRTRASRSPVADVLELVVEMEGEGFATSSQTS